MSRQRAEKSSAPRKAVPQRDSVAGSSGASLAPPPYGIDVVDKHSAAIRAIASRGLEGTSSGLPHLTAIQRSFGRYDIRDVQAYSGAQARAASHAIGANAYTSGSKIAFANTPTLHTAAHEAAHVVQQRAGVQLKAGIGEVGDRYERHADTVAERVVQGRSAEALLAEMAEMAEMAPSTSRRVQEPAVQGAWISQHNNNKTLYRFWKDHESDTFVLDTGWYKRTDANGEWDEGNVEAIENMNPDFPTEGDLLLDPLTDLQTRYDLAPNEALKKASKRSKLWPRLAFKVWSHSKKLQAPMKLYRWGEYQYEKDYVINNGFNLDTVNHSADVYGKGLYVAKNPWGSTSFANKPDSSLIEVTVPTGTIFLDPFQNKQDGRRIFSEADFKALLKNPRYPALLECHKPNGWYVIKDDRLNLEIDFFKPDRETLDRITPHFEERPALDGYRALQIINRQLGTPLPLPEKTKLLEIFVKASQVKQQQVQKYIQKTKRFEFVPFFFTEGELTFTDEVDGWFKSFEDEGLDDKERFSEVESELKAWAKAPFDWPSAALREVVQRFKEKELEHSKVTKNEKLEKKLVTFRWLLEEFAELLEFFEEKPKDVAQEGSRPGEPQDGTMGLPKSTSGTPPSG